MVSKTKIEFEYKTIKALFSDSGIGDAASVSPLGKGEFNAVYSVWADGKNYAIKIAPDPIIPVMIYEKGIMASEIFWYEQIRKNTAIRTPDIHCFDMSGSSISSSYFIMDKLQGKQMNEMDFSKEEESDAISALARMVAEIHKIKNDKFGYIQCGLHNNWYLAIRAMVSSIIEDCAMVERASSRGIKLLNYIDAHRTILEKAECCMVNFDLWKPNVLCTREADGIHYAWIDPERSFWGDPIMDFICLETIKPLKNKEASLAAYNAAADIPITVTHDELTRYAVAQGYLALIFEVEKYFRYTPYLFGWWRNIAASRIFYKSAFKTLSDADAIL